MKSCYKRVSSFIQVTAVLMMIGCAEKKKEVKQLQHPNVIVIMTDDQGYGDIAAHGNPIIQTPNLDKLYGESVRFTDFHVNPFCAPTRAALMTGRISDRTHVRSTVYARNHLNLDETTMAEFFKDSGYKTGHFGKWHLGQNYPYRPMDRGFDVWVGHGDGGTGSASDYWGNDRMNDTYIRDGKPEKFNDFGTDVFFNETIDFIDQNKEKPFFVYLATNVPHRPWNVKEEWYETYKNVDSTQYDNWFDVRDFLATITHFDKNLGKLRDYLKENDLEENTILVFLTDNGTSGGGKIFNAGMRGKKGSMYDGGHRVPLYISWPKGGLNKGVDIDEFTAHIDLLPTLMDLCNLQEPKRAHLNFDGENLTPLLKGEQDSISDRYLVMHQQNTREIPVKGMNSLVATKQWRLVNGKELYDIKIDPEQTKNLAEEYPAVVEKLNNKYDKHWDELNMEQHPHPLPIIGHTSETVLVPDAWIRDTKANTWDQMHIANGLKGGGFWPVKINEKGNYEFEVRRWPRELDEPINVSELDPKNGDIFRHGKKVADYGYGVDFFNDKEENKKITKVGFEIDGKYLEKDIGDLDTHATFSLKMGSGPTSIRGWLIDTDGNKHGAYYVYANKL